MPFPMPFGSSVHAEFVARTDARLNARERGIDEAEFRSIIDTTYIRAWHRHVKIKPRCSKQYARLDRGQNGTHSYTEGDIPMKRLFLKTLIAVMALPMIGI